MSKKRTRLPADQAKKLILEAAERHLAQAGPDGIRLTELAKELGISHPAILHHFGSRDGLVREVVRKATADLERDIIATISEDRGDDPDDDDRAARAIEGVFELLADRNYARTLVWLQLTGDDAVDPSDHSGYLRRLTDLVHGIRVGRLDIEPSYQDTLFTVAMTSFAIFGASIAPASVEEAGIDPKQFRAWFAKIVLRQLQSPPP